MKKIAIFLLLLLPISIGVIYFLRDPAPEVFHADYVGSQVCGDCHFINYAAWEQSPHHHIASEPGPDAFVANFSEGAFFIPEKHRKSQFDHLPAAKMYNRNGDYFMALRDIGADTYSEMKIDKVIGFQYRQTFLTKEGGGVLRRLPIQWSVPRNEFFAYWNEQEQSIHSVHDMWEQMKPLNSAWNLYCARCHTTNLEENSKDRAHSKADVEWTELGVGCEVCHGPGSDHVEYMDDKPMNRLASWLDQRFFDKQAPFIMNAAKQKQGVALSVCARCHGADIMRTRMPLYRNYRPGYDKEGNLNDLSPYFTEAELVPGRTIPTVEVWPDGRPKGLGTLFRSFADSKHYQETDMRCYDCHDPHDNKKPAEKGLLRPSVQSNQFCSDCHMDIVKNSGAHSKHKSGTEGSYCYDCHMPKNMLNQVSGVPHFVRAHNIGTIPNPLLTQRMGMENSPNACNECHSDETPEWAVDHLRQWGMDKHLIDSGLHLQRNAHSDTVH